MIDGGKKGQPVVPGASITRTSSGSRSSLDSSTQSSRFPWREKNESDDEEWEFPTGAAAGRRRRSARLTPMSSKQIKSPEVVDMCDIDSDIEEVGAPEEPTVSWLMLFCGSACPLGTYTSFLEYMRLKVELELTRMAIGKKVCYAECHATLDPATMVLELRYKMTGARTTRTRTDDRNSFSTLRLTLRDGTLRKIILYEGVAAQQSDAIVDTDDEIDQVGPLVVLHIDPTVENGLDQYRRHLDPNHDTNKAMRYLVLELREKDDLRRIMGLLSRLPEKVMRIDGTPENVQAYAISLLNNKRSRSRATKRNAFLDGRPSDYALLVYPFTGDPTEMEGAADGLTEAAGTRTAGATIASPVCGEEDQEGEGKSRHRAHFVTITVDDYDRLQPGEWLNDSLVDLWMQWYVHVYIRCFDKQARRGSHLFVWLL